MSFTALDFHVSKVLNIGSWLRTGGFIRATQVMRGCGWHKHRGVVVLQPLCITAAMVLCCKLRWL